MARFCLALFLGFGLISVSFTGQAHDLGESYGTIDWHQDQISVAYNMRADQFIQLADPRFFDAKDPLHAFETEVMENYNFYSEGELCQKTDINRSRYGGFFRLEFQLHCSHPSNLKLVNHAFLDVLPDHLHFVKFNDSNGKLLGEKILDTSDFEWQVMQGSAPPPPSLWRYARLGANHIFLGPDHLAFLLSILLLIRGFAPLAIAITGFTLGHSLSLVLTVLGYAIPDGTMIEALIGLTIALVAGEVIFAARNEQRTYAIIVGACCVLIALASSITGAGPNPPALIGVGLFYAAYLGLTQQKLGNQPAFLLTGLFGLIHGFGFAGSLLQIGLPETQLALNLFVFNVGIEVAQLAFVTFVMGLVLGIKRLLPALSSSTWPTPLLAAALASIGMFWFVSRAWA